MPNLTDEMIFDTIDSPLKAYWLGFIFADGSVNKYNLTIELSNVDVDHLYKFKSFIDSTATITQTAKNCNSIRINSQYLTNSLGKYGIIQRKTYLTSKLPELNPNLFRFFLTGLMDGDGWISEHKLKNTNKSSFEFGFSSYHKSIMEYIQSWFCEHLNKKCGYISAREGKCPQLIIGGRKNFVEIYHLLYDDCPESLKRKKDKADKFLSIILNDTKCAPYTSEFYLAKLANQQVTPLGIEPSLKS